MLAICFYTDKGYEKLKLVAKDKNNICKTYADWLIQFTKTMIGLKEAGAHPVPITIDIDDLEKWCKESHCKNTGENRARYAQQKASLMVQTKVIISPGK